MATLLHSVAIAQECDATEAWKKDIEPGTKKIASEIIHKTKIQSVAL